MRRYSANYIFPSVGAPIRNGIIEVDEEGTVLNIISQPKGFEEIHSTEFYNGVIVPGFINAHCHLELSHLLGVFPKQLGLPGFIKMIDSERNISQEQIQVAIENALIEMYNTGTVAVGDICNCTDTLEKKIKSSIHFQNFIEVFGIDSTEADSAFSNVVDVYNAFNEYFPTTTSIVPHSPYTISDELWMRLSKVLTHLTSIHFAESIDEYDLIQHHKGALFERYSNRYKNYSAPSGDSPSNLIINRIPSECELLLIHCNFANDKEFDSLRKHFKRTSFVTCPESNLFIEGRMANLPLMQQMGLNIAMGTDSLASATTLSMLHNINIILNSFKAISFSEVLGWATINGANALNISDRFGSIEVGKRPGLNLITAFDFNTMKPTARSLVKRLI